MYYSLLTIITSSSLTSKGQKRRQTKLQHSDFKLIWLVKANERQNYNVIWNSNWQCFHSQTSNQMTFVRFGVWKIPRPNGLFGIFHRLTWQNFLSRAFKPLLALWQVCVCLLRSLHKLQCFASASPQQHWCFLPSLRLGKKTAIWPWAFVKP